MKKVLRNLASVCLVTAISVNAALSQQSDPPGESEKERASATYSHIRITLGRKGKVTLNSPTQWKQRKPRFNMIDYEFVAPETMPGQGDARVTIMGAGGDVKQNINRWKHQFHDQGRRVTTKQLEIAGQEVHLVDIAGTFVDRPMGPRAIGKTTLRKDYRALAAILVTPHGRYYVKMIGPQATVTAHEEAFRAMLDDLQVERP